MSSAPLQRRRCSARRPPIGWQTRLASSPRPCVASSSPRHGVHPGRANAIRRNASTSSAPARPAKWKDYEASRFIRPRRADPVCLEPGGRLNSPVATNRTAEFGRGSGKSAAGLRQDGAGGADVCIPEVGRGLRVQVRHGGLLGCGGACHRSSLTSNAFHGVRVKPVRRT